MEVVGDYVIIDDLTWLALHDNDRIMSYNVVLFRKMLKQQGGQPN